MKRILGFLIKILFCYAFCGGFYLLLETIWKIWSGTSTHISMYYLAGFISIPALLLNNIFTYETDYLFQCILCTVCATIGEGFTGQLVNADYALWNYTNLPFTFWNGQCNIFFCFAWFLLFVIFIPILDYIEWKLFDYKEEIVPYYKIFGKKIFDMEDLLKLFKE